MQLATPLASSLCMKSGHAIIQSGHGLNNFGRTLRASAFGTPFSIPRSATGVS